MSSGELFVVSAPSGTGKTTLIRRLLADLPGIDFSVSFTTRPMREGEKEGVDYHFIDDVKFDGMLAAGEFLEWARVHGRRYGTGSRLVDASLAFGHDVLLDIDTQGAASVRKLRKEAVLIFILPPDPGTLEARLRGRRLESGDEARRRLSNAKQEMERHTDYDHLVINDDMERALRELTAIVLAHRSGGERRRQECRLILESFQTR